MNTIRYTLASLLLTICFSCNKIDVLEEQGIYKLQNSFQKWELVAILSSWTNDITTGENLDRMEFYVFNPNGTFLKSRKLNRGAISEATGTYSVISSSGEEYLELIFKTGDDLQASCTSGKEFLILRENTLSNRSWVPCDGPGFEYRLSED